MFKKLIINQIEDEHTLAAYFTHMRFFTFICLLAFAQIALAQPCNYLAYEAFDYPANTSLHGLQGGTGWLSPWVVQNDNTSLPGYQTASGAPMQWLDLQS